LIYLTVPVHNEAKTIGVLLWKLRKLMAEFERDYRVFVLDDASTDGTPEILSRYGPFLPLRVIRSEDRIGYGGALERLVREVVKEAPYPKRDVVVTIQGDFTEEPEDLVRLVKAIEGGADLVAGSLEGEARALPARLRFSRWSAGLLLGRSVREAPVSDPLSGFRAYRLVILKKALRELGDGEPLLKGDGWSANLELLSRTAPHARRIEEAPYRIRLSHRPRGTRFRPVATLRSLFPLRGTDWSSLQGEA
jgi:glycosyltransferase involved in cell wall biosynthesis